MTSAEYWDKLNAHDWYYDFSDDHRVWERGTKQEDDLRALANSVEDGKELYEAFHKYMFSGKSWGTERFPKPERPNE